jgi:Cu/Ag efflux protein CusF
MKTTSSLARYIATTASTIVLATACSQLGGLGSVLGGATQPQASQVSGTVQGVDTRNQQIVLQATNGQSVALFFDTQTQVTYQNRAYSVTNLERGDRVTARIQQTQNGGYYTDLVQVDQSVQDAGGVSSGNNGSTSGGTVQSLQGTVRQVDLRNGLFTVDIGNYNTLTVSMPYNPSTNDQARFQNLRAGDVVRFYGVFLNNTRVELRRFY